MIKQINKYLRLFIICFIFIISTQINSFANGSWTYKSFTSNYIPDIEYKNNVLVVANGSIYTSTDNSQSWQITFSPSENGSYNDVYIFNNEFIVSGQNVQAVKSSDGITWSPVRIDETIDLNQIKPLGNKHLYLSSNDKLIYSENLLSWEEISLPQGEKIEAINVANDKCFIETKTNKNLIKYWVLDDSLVPVLLDNIVTSINNISYLSKPNKYINIINDKLHYLISDDGQNWEQQDLSQIIVDELNPLTYNTKNIDGKLFLYTGINTYITNEGSIWLPVGECGNISDLQYSGEYFYNINNLKGIFLSKGGMDWSYSPLNNKITALSTLKIASNKIILMSPYKEGNTYNSELYIYSISHSENTIPDINNENTINSEEIEDLNENSDNVKVDEIDIAEAEQEPEKTNFIKLKINSKEMSINDESKIAISTAPIIENGVSLVPIKDVMVQIGASLSWDENENEVTIYYQNKIIQLWLNSSEFKINGNSFELPIPFKSVDGIALIPVKPLMEKINCPIEWVNETNEIKIMY